MQNLVEYILRQKIYDSLYWKQDCFGLSAERIVDKAIELRFIGGMFGEPQKPTEFICLVLKMLQIQPDKEIILEFIKNDDFKYLRLLGAFYLRLVGKAVDVFNYLEPLLNDYRRVRVRDPSGAFVLSHIDELIDQMLRGDYLFHIALPRLPARHALEKNGQLEPRVSVLDDEFEEEVRKEQAEKEAAEAAAREDGEMMAMEERRKKEKWQLGRNEKNHHHSRRRSRSRSRERDYRSRSRDRDGNRGRDGSRERDRRDHRGRHRDREDYVDRRGDEKRPRRDNNTIGDGEDGEYEEGERGGGKDALSIEETNKMRASLGLAPLK
jgi:pre-mRNA-splicing factor 38A